MEEYAEMLLNLSIIRQASWSETPEKLSVNIYLSSKIEST